MLRRQALSAISFSILSGTVLPTLTFGQQPSADLSTDSVFQLQLQALQQMLATSAPATATVTECHALTTETLIRLSRQQALSASFCQCLADAILRVVDSVDTRRLSSGQPGTDQRQFLLALHQQLLNKVWVIAAQTAA